MVTYFTEIDPDVSLSKHVSCYWHLRAESVPDAHPQEVLPDGCTNLVIARRERGETTLTIQGPAIQSLHIPIWSGDLFWGVRFWPDVGPMVLGLESSLLRGSMKPAADVFDQTTLDRLASVAGNPDVASTKRALDKILTPLVSNSPPVDRVVRAAVLAIVAGRGGPPVSQLAGELTVSQRQLQRRFKSAVGLTMKQFARIRRMRAALNPMLALPAPNWAGVAVDLGFADQAHLVREFVALAGMSPTVLADRIRKVSVGRMNPFSL